MTYQSKAEICPYKQTNGSKCSHKLNGKFCSFSKKEQCQLYNDWETERKSTTDAPDDYTDIINRGVNNE